MSKLDSFFAPKSIAIVGASATKGKPGRTVIENLIANEFRGKNLSCAYDATHGFSDQYLVEYDFFLYCAKKAGLVLNNNFTFPNQEIPTISISYFK